MKLALYEWNFTMVCQGQGHLPTTDDKICKQRKSLTADRCELLTAKSHFP